jgi:hypothetical protein
MSAPVHAPTAAEEADPGHHVGDHPHGFSVAGDAHAQIHEGRCADRDQHIGAQPGGALAVLPFCADQRAEHERGDQADHGVQEGVQLEGLDEAHSESLQGRA